MTRVFVGDFETTVYKGQVTTEVWASACVEMFTEDVHIFHSIQEQLDYFISLKCNISCYYHNLKFDGAFWLSYLITHLGLTQAYETLNEEGTNLVWLDNKNMPNNSFKYMISDMGQWYTVTMKIHNRIIELKDSLKLLPFAVKRIGKAFKTKHQKLDMEYEGFRYAGCEITDEEKEYIANDVLVVKEGLETMLKEGHNKMTIGSCCLSEYKKIMGKDYETLFPVMLNIPLNYDTFKAENVDEYIRHSYRGGWCYCVKGKENILYHNGTTADVNSLYPSMMSSESGNLYPTGSPKFWSGNFIPDECYKPNRYWFIRIKTRFYIKENMLPFIQIKGNHLYKGTEMLESSDYIDKLGNRHTHIYNKDGTKKSTRVTMTMTMTDYKLFLEHYNVCEFEILDGCYFYAIGGIFDDYINKYKKIKQESTGALRELAKLFLNNLYGKMASSDNSSFKVAKLKDDGSLGYFVVPEHEKDVGYIPVGSAITSYARNFTIRTAQMNYYGIDKRGFIYADTDSIHCDLKPDELKGVKVHDKDFCCWKLESCWNEGWFVRQKTYIEHVTHENLEPIEKPYYNVKCAGMPDKCKQYFIKSMEGLTEEEIQKEDEEIQEFLRTKRNITDFKLGLKIYGKLLPHNICGGVLLVPTTYEMR